MSTEVEGRFGLKAAGGSVLFSMGVFAGAYLIFLVQPMVAKRILPWFGGGPGVWMICLMFYQTTLFFGYAYAHALIQFARPAVQLGVHSVLFAASFATLPVLPGDSWKPGAAADPSLSIITLLLAKVALPFITLAATGPLLQSWFARRYPARSPYALYAVSNFGSLAALLAFPLLMEPFLSLEATGQGWSWGFVLAGTLILTCGVAALPVAGSGLSGGGDAQSEGSEKVAWQDFSLWLGLSACAVVLLMAVTNKLCLDVASVPFLWVVPLSLYLISLILCFGSERLYSRKLWLLVIAVILSVQVALSSLDWSQLGGSVLGSFTLQIVLYGAILFALCMLAHGELYRIRPSANRLTFFYLAVSGGGALGGLFVGLGAPNLFDGYYELAFGFGLASVLILWALFRDERSWISYAAPVWRRASTGLACAVFVSYLGFEIVREDPGTLHQERSFFGVLRVTETDPENPMRKVRSLLHGNTLHGVQFVQPGRKAQPTSYYGNGTGIGIALAEQPKRKPLKVGVVGLGVGTLAAYGRPGDVFRFYEIDPSVIQIASESDMFSYLSDSSGTVEVVEGDARLSLSGEMAEGRLNEFDILVVDAFSSDSIPVHLMTREAFELYFDHVAAEGLVAVHVSNRYFDLAPVIYRIARAIGAEVMTIKNAPTGSMQLGAPSKWIFLSRDAERLHSLRQFSGRRWESLGLAKNLLFIGVPSRASFGWAPLWTDDYSSLLGLLGGAR